MEGGHKGSALLGKLSASQGLRDKGRATQVLDPEQVVFGEQRLGEAGRWAQQPAMVWL